MDVASPLSHDLEIALAKSSVMARIVVGLVFLGVGLQMYRSSEYPILGGAAALFSAWMLYYGFRLLLDTKPGLVLGNLGLIINNKIGSGGTVPWTDVNGLDLVRYGHDYQLVVNVKHPELYIAHGNAFYRALNSLGARLFGSPIRINTGFLDYDRKALLTLVNEYRARHGST